MPKLAVQKAIPLRGAIPRRPDELWKFTFRCSAMIFQEAGLDLLKCLICDKWRAMKVDSEVCQRCEEGMVR